MKRHFFEPVTEYDEADIERLLAAGETEEVLLTLEHWRFLKDWDRVASVVSRHRELLPNSCELYLAEIDQMSSHSFESDHTPIANPAVCRSHIDSLAARNRYYFRGPGNIWTNTKKRRKQIQEFKKNAPERSSLWNVLHAETLKVRSQRDFDRVLDLCRPAINACDGGIDESELSDIALTIVFNAAMAARNQAMIEKARAALCQSDDLRADENSVATFLNLRASENHTYNCTENDNLGLDCTTAHLSRLYRDLCRGVDLNPHLKELSNQLCHKALRNPIYEIRLSLDISPLTYPHYARITEDDLCDLIRIKQGPLNSLGPAGEHLATLCHATGGVASAGLDPGETNRDIRALTERLDTYWAYRGLAYRIIRSNSSHLIPNALRYLSKAYARPGWSPQKSDPLFLFFYGTEPFVTRIEKVLKWGVSQGDKSAFHQAMEDIVLPVLIELPSIDDEPLHEYSAEAKDLLLTYAQSDFLEPDPGHLEAIFISFSAMGLGTETLGVVEKWLARWGHDKDLQSELAFILTDAAESFLPPRQALELLEAKRQLFASEDIKQQIQGTIDDLQCELAKSTKIANHYMLFDSALPAGRRSDLSHATPREFLQLGATCAYLEAPNSQTLLAFGMINGPLTIEPDGWPSMLKNLMQHRLLQIRLDGPEGAFELTDDDALSWYPDRVDLAVNVHVDGDAGRSQAGILMTLPTLIRKLVLSMPPAELLTLWRSFVRSEAQVYFLCCLNYFERPSEPEKGDSEVFQSAPESFSLAQLMNLIYNSCRAAAGEQKAQRLSLKHARNLARKILKNRMLSAQEKDWNIGSGFRGDMMPTPYLVQYFATVFLPMGEPAFEKRKPNLSTIEDALLTLRTGA